MVRMALALVILAGVVFIELACVKKRKEFSHRE
jgi:hypothetical protein